MVDHWQNIGGLTYEEAAARIYADGIDILVDLSGHTNGGATLIISSYKPAPVQVCGIGWFNTTGLKAMDFFLTDQYCSPEGQGDTDFSEQLIRLPHTHLCYTPPDYMRICPETWHRRPKITFGSFNNFAKITDDMLRLWLSILNQVPGAKLLLKNSYQGAVHQQTQLLARARRIGYQASQLELRMATDGLLQEYRELDIALDTYPYPGGGTTCDALYYGVPVITLAGKHHGSRFGASILKNLGLGNLVADTPEEYAALAITLAGETELLAKLHQILPERMKQSPLMDGPGYVREIEAAYETIWAAWLRQENPEECRILIK
jgi:predicted O-linked N-acetylglucosamine transferase (SPINDLY family)